MIPVVCKVIRKTVPKLHGLYGNSKIEKLCFDCAGASGSRVRHSKNTKKPTKIDMRIWEEASWRGHHWAGIMKHESWRRHHGEGIGEESSGRRHHGGSILEEASWRSILEASGRHQASGKHLGDIHLRFSPLAKHFSKLILESVSLIFVDLGWLWHSIFVSLA
jgi:hypothetical protein